MSQDLHGTDHQAGPEEQTQHPIPGADHGYRNDDQHGMQEIAQRFTAQNGKKICDNEKDGYVPDFLCPADSGYGDYMIMDINEEGHIADWNKIDFDDWVLTMKED